MIYCQKKKKIEISNFLMDTTLVKLSKLKKQHVYDTKTHRVKNRFMNEIKYVIFMCKVIILALK